MADGMATGQVIVTGGSRGIGKAIATALDGAGYDVVSVSRSGDTPAGRGIACDLTDEAALKAAFAEIGAAGPVAGLVNNAGFHITAKSASLATEDYEKVMALNATAVMLASREAYPMLCETRGTIVNIGSFFDKMGVPDNLAYCASKAAVGAITRCLAVEWAKDGIRVMNVAPGYIATDLNSDYLARDKVKTWLAGRIPTGGPGTPEDVAKLVTSLMTGAIPYLTGETIYIDGGQGMNH
jgi:NAD(P)-dependent dehydrogenase (short-subunit alcohol dehydrogenase family)